jgi:hypothetical protein
VYKKKNRENVHKIIQFNYRSVHICTVFFCCLVSCTGSPLTFFKSSYSTGMFFSRAGAFAGYIVVKMCIPSPGVNITIGYIAVCGQSGNPQPVLLSYTKHSLCTVLVLGRIVFKIHFFLFSKCFICFYVQNK